MNNIEIVIHTDGGKTSRELMQFAAEDCLGDVDVTFVGADEHLGVLSIYCSATVGSISDEDWNALDIAIEAAASKLVGAPK